ncbi:hypothetical protein AHiyo8_19590 [Arthrobacter sp. Hiyo8]|nr:hypothetical protein AHiyo8_19590 [Arthrobacter sp. Hiyo8]
MCRYPRRPMTVLSPVSDDLDGAGSQLSAIALFGKDGPVVVVFQSQRLQGDTRMVGVTVDGVPAAEKARGLLRLRVWPVQREVGELGQVGPAFSQN